jgi:hypothetical protein
MILESKNNTEFNRLKGIYIDENGELSGKALKLFYLCVAHLFKRIDKFRIKGIKLT